MSYHGELKLAEELKAARERITQLENMADSFRAQRDVYCEREGIALATFETIRRHACGYEEPARPTLTTASSDGRFPACSLEPILRCELPADPVIR